jgi:hypothetical protein
VSSHSRARSAPHSHHPGTSPSFLILLIHLHNVDAAATAFQTKKTPRPKRLETTLWASDGEHIDRHQKNPLYFPATNESPHLRRAGQDRARRERGRLRREKSSLFIPRALTPHTTQIAHFYLHDRGGKSVRSINLLCFRKYDFLHPFTVLSSKESSSTQVASSNSRVVGVARNSF